MSNSDTDARNKKVYFFPMKLFSIYMDLSINVTLDISVKPIHVLLIESILKSPKLNVCCVMSKNQLISSKMIQLMEKILCQCFNNFIFQRFGNNTNIDLFYLNKMMLVRTSLDRCSILFLNNRLPNRWIGRDGAVRWVPRSPDLTPLDLYLWGHLKSNVYISPIKDIDVLKMRANMEIKSISKGTLNDVFLRIL